MYNMVLSPLRSQNLRLQGISLFAHFSYFEVFLILLAVRRKGGNSMENSLANKKPWLVAEWSERNGSISPDDVPYGSKKLYWWHGSCGHEWQASAKARSSGENCPICSNARIVAGINDLASLKPELLKEWSPKNTIRPTEIGVGSHKKVLWIGACGHEWSAEIRNRVRELVAPTVHTTPSFKDSTTLQLYCRRLQRSGRLETHRSSQHR